VQLEVVGELLHLSVDAVFFYIALIHFVLVFSARHAKNGRFDSENFCGGFQCGNEISLTNFYGSAEKQPETIIVI
jgi:hypothetical protein